MPRARPTAHYTHRAAPLPFLGGCFAGFCDKLYLPFWIGGVPCDGDLGHLEGDVAVISGREQGPDVGGKQWIVKLRSEIPLKEFVCDVMNALVHIFGERSDNAGRVHRWIFQSGFQVKQVPTLPALIQGTQFRAQTLVKLVARDLTGAFKPARRNREGDAGEAVNGKMLT